MSDRMLPDDVTDDPTILAIHLRPEWKELPADGRDAWVEETAAGFDIDDEARLRLSRSLEAAVRNLDALAPGSRRSFALVVAPELGRVDAVLSVRYSQVTQDAYANYLAAARAVTSTETVELLNRKVEEVLVPAGPAVVVSDILVPARTGAFAPAATERAFLAVFPEGWATAMDFTYLSQNLGALDDAAEYLVGIASGQNPALRGTEDAS